MVTNTTIAPLYLDKTISALTDGNPSVTVESVILPDGEKYKDMVCILRILRPKVVNVVLIKLSVISMFIMF